MEITNKHSAMSLDLVSSYNLGFQGYYDKPHFMVSGYISVSRGSVLNKILFSEEDPVSIIHILV